MSVFCRWFKCSVAVVKKTCPLIFMPRLRWRIAACWRHGETSPSCWWDVVAAARRQVHDTCYTTSHTPLAVSMATSRVCATWVSYYDTAQYSIFHSLWKWQGLNIDQSLISQKTPHSLPSRASYEVSIVSILEEIDCVVCSRTAL